MDRLIVALIDGIVVPVTSVIPLLVSSGLALLVFAALWAGFGWALARSRPTLDAAWQRVHRQPLPLAGLAWLLFLPVLAGLWVWRRRAWPVAARLVVIAGLAGWNLLIFVPQPA